MGKLRNQIQKLKQNVSEKKKIFQDNFSKVKIEPRSKRQAFLLGATTTLSIFGVALLAPVLPAVAKETAKNIPKPGDGPAPAVTPDESNKIISGLSGAASAIYSVAVSSGSFVVGAACGLMVAIGLLMAQERLKNK